MEKNETGKTVWHAFYSLLRSYGMTTVFGNPGSTEEPMLKNFPTDFEYVLALQEASVVAMADGFSQANGGKPVLVSVHTAPGTGNGMGNVMGAALNKTPLIIIAGQQTREMLIGEPMLTNRDETMLARPYVTWSYQPAKASDVPAALVRAIAVATQPPAGPVYLSIPLDDGEKECPLENAVPPRAVSTRFAPDPEQLTAVAGQFMESKNLALILGAEVDKSNGLDAAIQLAEMLNVPVFQAPLAERAVFPETHRLFKGALPMAKGPLSTKLEGLDMVLVVGAEVFRYYPYVAGPVTPPGMRLVQITNDPHDARTALVGDSVLSDARLALESLCQLLRPSIEHRTAPFADPDEHSSHPAEVLLAHSTKQGSSPIMTAMEAFQALAELRPAGALLVQETPSNGADFCHAWSTIQPGSFFTFASGGLGWNAPAAVGIALAQKKLETNRPTILAIGDGSLHYSVQSMYTAAQQKLDLIYLVPLNDEYAILKEFAVLEETPDVPGLDLPGLNAAATAKAYGVVAFRAENPDELRSYFSRALATEGHVLIEFPIDRQLRPLVAKTAARG